MDNLLERSSDEARTNEVTVAFERALFTFSMSADATLGDLARHLERLGHTFTNLPTVIVVRQQS